MAATPAFNAIKQVYPPAAFASYHGGVAMRDNVIVNFPFIDSPLMTGSGTAPSGVFGNDDYYLRPIERSLAMNAGNVLIHSSPGRRSSPSGDHFVFAGAIVDEEGLFGSPGGNWVFDVAFLTAEAACTPVSPTGLNGQTCDGRYYGAEAFVLDHGNDYFYPLMRLEVSRRAASDPDAEIGAWHVAGVPPEQAASFPLPNMRHFAMRQDGVFVLRFPEYAGPLADVNMVIGNMPTASDRVVLAVDYRGDVAHVFATTYESYARSPAVAGPPAESTPLFRGYTQVGTREEVLSSDGEAFYHDVEEHLVWIKLRGGIEDAYVADPSLYSDETLYEPFVLRIHDDTPN
jgi:hypothetical protein